jgi:hypothetical protein
VFILNAIIDSHVIVVCLLDWNGNNTMNTFTDAYRLERTVGAHLLVLGRGQKLGLEGEWSDSQTDRLKKQQKKENRGGNRPKQFFSRNHPRTRRRNVEGRSTRDNFVLVVNAREYKLAKKVCTVARRTENVCDVS